jgi:hypothetical protein
VGARYLEPADHGTPLSFAGKPVIIKELGMQPGANRDPFYTLMYTDALDQITATRTAAGGLRVSRK